jgi:putative oxidoreductase
MNSIMKRVETLADSQHSKTLDVLRIVLGFIILGKGIYFINNTTALLDMMSNSKIEFLSFMLTHYVAMAQLVGGVLIILGLLTRLAIAFQLPILLGAILFVNINTGFFSIHSELEFSILVFSLLLFFFFYGSGSLSVDEYMRKHRGV